MCFLLAVIFQIPVAYIILLLELTRDMNNDSGEKSHEELLIEMYQKGLVYF